MHKTLVTDWLMYMFKLLCSHFFAPSTSQAFAYNDYAIIQPKLHHTDLNLEFPQHDQQTFFLQNLRARLSLEILSNSNTLFSYGAKPQTSRTKSRANFVCFVKACKHQNNFSSVHKADQPSHMHFWLCYVAVSI